MKKRECFEHTRKKRTILALDFTRVRTLTECTQARIWHARMCMCLFACGFCVRTAGCTVRDFDLVRGLSKAHTERGTDATGHA